MTQRKRMCGGGRFFIPMELRKTFVLEIRSEPQAGWMVPQDLRLRQVLKRLLRSYGFRCIDIRETGETESEEERIAREIAEL